MIDPNPSDTTDGPAAAPEAALEKSPPSEPASSPAETAPVDARFEGGDDGDGGSTEVATAEGGAPTEGGEKKKRRARRRRKKGPGAAGAEGASAGGGEAAAGGEGQAPRPPKPKPKPRPERKRPAFNVGDVVFGKVLEVTEDALFADLAGKAKAIFDLRELLITDEDVEEYEKAARKEAETIAAARAASGGGTKARPTESTEGATAEGAESTETAVAVTPAPDDSTGAVTGAEAVAPAADAASEAAPAAEENEEAPPVDGAAERDKPRLPRVVLEPGAPFVGLVHNDGGRGGLVVVTHHPKRVQKAKPIVSEASRSGTLIDGLVTGTIKGGLEVDVDGLRAFAPASHVELRPGADLSHLVGKRLPFAVTQCAKRGRDVVLSRRAILETEAKERRDEALKNLEMGSTVVGVVRSVVPFGAFVDVGGVEGLVPLGEMSHSRAERPKHIFKVGETCEVKLLSLDERGKLWLSRKAAIDDPWNEVATKYARGSKHKGRVACLQPFGAFIELEAGIDGLIHTADLSVMRIEHPEEVVRVGDEIDVVVASVDPRQRRIALHPAPTGEAANETPQKIQVGKTVTVVVVSIEPDGLAVRVLGATGRHARGFISGAATGTPRGTELRKLFPVGKELEVKIVALDRRRGELELSLKALAQENERSAYQQYRAQVRREAKFGTFADLLAKRNKPSK